MSRLGRLARTISGVGFPPSEQGATEGDLPFLKVSDLADPRNCDGIVTSANWVSASQARRLGVRRVPAGSVIFPKVGAALLGNARGLTRVECALDNNMMAVAPLAGDPRYWLYVLRAVDMGELNMSGTLPFVSDSAVRDLDLPIDRETEEQQRIADFLDDQVARIDNIITARTQQLVCIEQMRTTVLTETFFAAELSSVPLSHVAHVDHGRQRSPENAQGDHMTRYVRSANVKDGFIDTADLLEMNFTPQEQRIYRLRAGDVLVTEASGSPDAIGASAIWREQLSGTVCFQNHLLRLRARDQASNPEYLGWWARASYYAGAMKVWATGANILNLGSASLRRMPLPARSMIDQAGMVARCNEIDRDCASGTRAVSRQAARLSEFKRSLITAAVTGEFNVSSADGSRVSA